MTTQITLNSVENVLRKIITESGTVMIRIPEDTLEQMNSIATLLRDVTDYSDDKLDADQLELAMERAERFENVFIGTSVVDGKLMPETEATISEVKAVINDTLKDAPLGFIAVVLLANKIVNETKSFAA